MIFKLNFKNKKRYDFVLENVLNTWPACDSAPGMHPKPPSKFKHFKTNETAFSLCIRSSEFLNVIFVKMKQKFYHCFCINFTKFRFQLFYQQDIDLNFKKVFHFLSKIYTISIDIEIQLTNNDKTVTAQKENPLS